MTKIICQNCERENEGTMKFCGKCGVSLGNSPEVSPETAPEIAPEAVQEPAPEIAQEPESEVTQELVPEPQNAEFMPQSQMLEAPPKDAAPATIEIAPAGKFNIKKLMLIAIPALVLVLTAVIAGLILIPPLFEVYKPMHDLFVLGGDDTTVLVYNNGKTATVGGFYLSHQPNIDGKKAALLVNENAGNNGGDNTRTLYYVTGSGAPVKVADGVNSYQIADSGNAIVYWTDVNLENHTAQLNLFDGNKSVVIQSEVYYDVHFDMSQSTAISPNGKTIFYVGEYADDNINGSTVAYISTNGNRGTKFADNVYPVAISNGAKQIYYARVENDDSMTLRVKRGVKGGDDNSVKLADYWNLDWCFFFNESYSQIVFNEGRRSFISVNGSQRESFADRSVSIFLQPQYSKVISRLSSQEKTTTTYGFADFKGKAFQSWGDGVSILTKNRSGYSSDYLSRHSTGQAVMTDDGKRIVFLDSGSLRTTSATNPNDDGFRITTDVHEFVVAGNHVYIVDRHNQIHRMPIAEGAGGSRLGDMVESGSLRVSGKGTAFFIADDDTLYSASGNKKNRVAQEIRYVVTGKNNTLYSTNVGGGYLDIFRNDGGDVGLFGPNFKPVARNVRWATGSERVRY